MAELLKILFYSVSIHLAQLSLNPLPLLPPNCHAQFNVCTSLPSLVFSPIIPESSTDCSK